MRNVQNGLVASVKACSKQKDLHKGNKLHVCMVQRGLLQRDDVYNNNALVDMYSISGAMKKAHEMLNNSFAPDSFSWTALIAIYVKNGHGEKALSCFDVMQMQGISPDVITLACVLKACAIEKDVVKGLQIHVRIVGDGLLEKHSILGNALLNMYAKCSFLEKAHEVFDSLPVWDVVSWTALISGYAQNGYYERSLHLFEYMKLKCFFPNSVTFASVLNAYSTMGASDKGKRVHAIILESGFLENNCILGNALVDMYAKCGFLQETQKVFDALPVRDVVTWSSLIGAYAQHGYGHESLSCFHKMQQDGIPPNRVTFLCILKACTKSRTIQKGQEIHSLIVKNGLLDKDAIIGTALVDMYANLHMLVEAEDVFNKMKVHDVVAWNALLSGYCKCGFLKEAREIFDIIPVRDVISWNILISAYSEHQHGEEALNCFQQMKLEGFGPDGVSTVCILKACGDIGALGKGQELHAEIVKDGLLENNMLVGDALVDMYGNLGMPAEAQDASDELLSRDVVSWTALIAVYAQLGVNNSAFDSFNKMIIHGKSPDLATFSILLTVCSHSGLLEEGQSYFDMMMNGFSAIPTLEHYTCIIDLFCRAGQIDKALIVVNEMPFSANLTVWHTMLGTCQKWADLKLATFAFECAVGLDKNDTAAYVCMQNIHAAAAM